MGRAGAGKSAVMSELKTRGYAAYDVDEISGVCSWRDSRTGELAIIDPRPPLDIDRYRWTLNDKAFRDFVAARDNFFVCVGAAGELDYTSLFDVSLVLDVTPDMHLKRLATRTNNSYGKDPEMAQKIVAHQAQLLKAARQRGFTAVDANHPIDRVVDEILALVYVGG